MFKALVLDIFFVCISAEKDDFQKLQLAIRNKIVYHRDCG